MSRGCYYSRNTVARPGYRDVEVSLEAIKNSSGAPPLHRQRARSTPASRPTLHQLHLLRHHAPLDADEADYASGRADVRATPR